MEECGDASSVDGLVSGVLDDGGVGNDALDRERCVEISVFAPGYAPVITLRGEVGTSNMQTSDLKTKICYEKLNGKWK